MSSSLDEEMIALRWNNHMATMSQLLYSLREEESMIDVTLACEGKLLPAHKFVLSMCSDYFKEMFTSNPCKHPIVFMKDVHSEDLEALLDFMYRGVVHIQKSALSTLLKTAEGLQIRGLGLIGQDASMQGDQNSLSGSGVERISLTALEPSVFLSPDRKRSYDINTNASSDHDASTSLANFSEADLDDHSMNTSHSGGSPHKKAMHRMIDHPPASVPDLPKINEDTLDIGCGITMPANDYMKLRRTNANRYVNDLLRYFFPLEVLAMSSLTGGECFANRGKTHGSKNQLDPSIIRVITTDAIRNFPMITEKQVRNAIRRKLNTESRTFRGLGKVSSGVRRPPNKRRPRQTPRPMVSIERSSHSLHGDNKPMLQHQAVTPNVTLEKTSTNAGIVFRNKENLMSPGTLVNRIQQQQQQQLTPQQQHQHQQQQQYAAAVVQQQTISAVGGVTATAQGLSLATSDKRSDDEAAAASAAAYFNNSAGVGAGSGSRSAGRVGERSSPASHHTSTPNSGTPPLVATTSIASSTSPSTTISEKTFNLVKAEVGGGGGGGSGGGGSSSGAQYLTQEYSYLPHVTSQPPTAYLPHHIADPAYLRRLEMSQAAAAVQQHTTTALSYTYPALPTSESMEPSLHM